MRDINSLNRVILVGRLRDKPILRYLARSERPVAHFDLATNELVYDPSKNESRRRAEWHRIIAWGKLAEFCSKYLTKGRQILIEGKLRSRTWEGRDGVKRKTTEIEARTIILLGKREEEIEAAEITEPEALAYYEPEVTDFPDQEPLEAEPDYLPETESEEEIPF
ncbi:MAG: single-stranded DNA-binding protein [Candidatus Aminicenantes bacterium]|nr:single-stranded DNA-binding protein [Candidatus Aminicenantes bacterium]